MPTAAERGEPVYRRTQPVVGCEAGGGLLLVGVGNGCADLDQAICLRDAGRFLWEQLTEQPSAAGLGRILAGAWEVPRDRADRDAAGFLEQLAGHGLLAREGALPARAARGDARGCAAGSRDPPLAGETLEALARAVLAAGHRLRFRARGRSMAPQLPDGSLLEVAPRPFADVRVGDVVLYGAGVHRLVAHRVIDRDARTLTTRGDSAARRDRVAQKEFLGVVTALWRESASGSTRVRLDTPLRRLAGVAAGARHRVRGFGRHCFAVVLRKSSLLRRAVRGSARLGSKLLRAVERRSFRLRRRLDVAHAALLTTEEKDRSRRRLYESKSVQDFTALDENVEAGLTLIEEHLLGRHPVSGRALVLGCGPGRESVALAQRGLQVTGLDRAAGMLERARALAERAGQTIRFLAGEIDSFDLGERFDVVVVFSGLYNMLLPKSRRVAMLQRAFAHLEPGGKVLLTFLSDYLSPGAEPPPATSGFWRRINPSHEDGDRWLRNEAVHVFPHPDSLAREARGAGFTIEEVFRDQRAYDRETRQVRGYAVLVRPR